MARLWPLTSTKIHEHAPFLSVFEEGGIEFLLGIESIPRFQLKNLSSELSKRAHPLVVRTRILQQVVVYGGRSNQMEISQNKFIDTKMFRNKRLD